MFKWKGIAACGRVVGTGLACEAAGDTFTVFFPESEEETKKNDWRVLFDQRCRELCRELWRKMGARPRQQPTKIETKLTTKTKKSQDSRYPYPFIPARATLCENQAV
jgi:hypothetical protein